MNALFLAASPCSQTRNPPWDVRAKFFVLGPIFLPQGRLFIDKNKEIESQPDYKTATYIGFRTYRNNPPTTKWRVGKIGAGVPSPWSAKRAKESKRTGRPTAIDSTPRTRSEEIPSRGAPTCHRQMRQGT